MGEHEAPSYGHKHGLYQELSSCSLQPAGRLGNKPQQTSVCSHIKIYKRPQISDLCIHLKNQEGVVEASISHLTCVVEKERMEIRKNRRWSLMLIIQARRKHEDCWEHKANLGL